MRSDPVRAPRPAWIAWLCSLAIFFVILAIAYRRSAWNLAGLALIGLVFTAGVVLNATEDER